jgi:hypothetical protein
MAVYEIALKLGTNGAKNLKIGAQVLELWAFKVFIVLAFKFNLSWFIVISRKVSLNY